MNKGAIHGQYMEAMKAKHANKPLRVHHNAVVVGANKDNIGEAIVRRFNGSDLFDNTWAPDISMLDVKWDVDARDYFTRGSDVDVLVLSHGYTALDWIENMNPREIEEIVSVNLTGTILAVQAFVQATLDKPFRKRIIVIGSMAYRAVLNASAAYCAAKAGVAHFVRCMGWELTPKGFDIFAVHPSNTENTPMTEKTIRELARFRQLDIEDARAYWASTNLMPRWLSAGDIAEVCHWLATTEAAAWLSGQQIDLPGGVR